MQADEAGSKLGEMIKKAIEDGQPTNSEYNQILSLADQDYLIDSQEKQRLKELQALLANKTVKKVPDYA
jgi:hypothetical protein